MYFCIDNLNDMRTCGEESDHDAVIKKRLQYI